MKFHNFAKKAALGTLGTLALVAGLIGPAMPVAAAGTSMSITPAHQNILTVGTEFEVNLVIDSDDVVMAAQAAVSFNKDVLNIISGSAGSYNKGKLFVDFATAAYGEDASDYYTTNPNGSTSTANTTGQTGTLGVSLVDMVDPESPDGEIWSLGPDGGIFWTLKFRAIAEGDSNIEILNGVCTDKTGHTISGASFNGGSVHVGAVTAPDLIITDVTPTWIDQVTGEYEVHFTVKNVGTYASLPCECTVTADTTPITVPCGALDPEGTDELSAGPFTLSAPSDSITVEADSNNANDDEIDEYNNTLSAVVSSNLVIVEGNVLTKLVMSVPQSLLDWDLEVGDDNSQTKTLNIKCNDNWTVTVRDDDRAEKTGHLTEFDGSDFLDRYLDNPLVLDCDGNTITALTNDEQLLADGIAADQGDDDIGQDMDVVFSQTVEYQDARLTTADGTVYHMVITFTAGTLP